MVIAKERILAQIQQDSAAYDAFSDALKDVLSKEFALVTGSYEQPWQSVARRYIGPQQSSLVR
jgi:hypothetical protein